MEFEWDEKKRQDTIKKHKVDMVEAALIFEGAVFTAVDERRDYGETRYISVGMVDDVSLSLFTHHAKDAFV